MSHRSKHGKVSVAYAPYSFGQFHVSEVRVVVGGHQESRVVLVVRGYAGTSHSGRILLVN
jgi:hypothetical protein